MSDIVEYNHKTIQTLSVKDLNKIDPDTINLDQIRRTALVLKKYLQEEKKDPYTICVKARGAMNSISECIRIVARMVSYYKTQSKRYFSIAKLEKADVWIDENKPGVKPTDGLRTAYAEMDEDYLLNKERENGAVALLEYLRNKRDDFEHDLNLAKKKMNEDYQEEQKAGYVNARDEE